MFPDYRSALFERETTGSGQLIAAGSVFEAAADAADALFDFLYRHALHQLGDGF